jgi:hypothetical protein
MRKVLATFQFALWLFSSHPSQCEDSTWIVDHCGISPILFNLPCIIIFSSHSCSVDIVSLNNQAPSFLDTLKAFCLLQWWWESAHWIPLTCICHHSQQNSWVDCRVQLDGSDWVICLCFALWEVWHCRLVIYMCSVGVLVLIMVCVMCWHSTSPT